MPPNSVAGRSRSPVVSGRRSNAVDSTSVVAAPVDSKASAILGFNPLADPEPEPLATDSAYAPGSHVSPVLGGWLSMENIVAVAICFGEVAAGCLLAPLFTDNTDPANPKPCTWQLWLECFGRLFFFMSAFIMVGSVFMMGLGVSCGRKMQPAGRATPHIVIEAFDSMRAMWVFAGLAAWPMMLYLVDSKRDTDEHATALVWTLERAQPWAGEWNATWVGTALYVLQLAVLTLVVDAYSHLKHKTMHTTMLWPFHKTHHTYRDPSAFAGFAVHPVEAFFTFVPVLGMCSNGMPVWGHAYAIWTLGWTIINLYLHSGYEIKAFEATMGPLMINTSGYHNYHHELLYTNFSELLVVWDWIFDSGFNPTGYGYGRTKPKAWQAASAAGARAGLKSA